MIHPVPGRQHLLFDADDTLWENNVYFERAFDDFVAFLNHERLGRSEVLAVMDELTIANRATHGYGARSFARSLRDTYHRITGVASDDDILDTVEQLGLRILDQEFELLDGVIPTVQALRVHHDLVLVTKGHLEEQRAKIDRSGMASMFDEVVIVSEKSEATYRTTVDRLGFDPAASWMIGNSPRSDINPAIRSGINAVYIPHPQTWHLEVEEITVELDGGQRLVELRRFTELVDLFHANTGAGPGASSPFTSET